MTVSIIIVNYNTFTLTCQCIECIYAYTKGCDFEIILIDNASTECSPTLFLEKFPNIKLIQNRENSGFARANNQGIRMAGGEIILLYNSDVFITDDIIAKNVSLFQKSPYVACGIQLLNADGTQQISGSYFVRGGLNYLLPLPYLGSLLKHTATLLKVKKPHIINTSDVTDVDWVNGAYLMVKKEAIEQAGLMDEDFFLYSEESEWCGRLRKKGKICIYGQLNAIHLQGASSDNESGTHGAGYKNIFDRKGCQILVSQFVRLRKQFGIGWFSFMLLVHIFEIPIMFIGVFFSFLFRFKKRYTFKEFGGYVKNMMKVIQLSGKIIQNKPYFYKAI